MKTTINLCLNDLISRHCSSLLKINPNILYGYILTGRQIGAKTKEERSSGRQKGGCGRLKVVLFTVLY